MATQRELIPPEDWRAIAEELGWTERESQVASWLFHDCERKEIARRLGGSASTARTFIDHVFTKTGVATKGQFILRVVELWETLKQERASKKRRGAKKPRPKRRKKLKTAKRASHKSGH